MEHRIIEFPVARTLKVKVAITPLPLTPVSTIKVQLVSGRSPSLIAEVDDKVVMNRVFPACCRKGPSVASAKLSMVGLNVMSARSHAHRFCTLLMMMLTLMVSPTCAEGNC